MGIISWIVFGLIAGAIAKFIMPSPNRPRGCLGTMILGIVGAVIGGFIGSRIFDINPVHDWSLSSFAIAVGGGILVLWISALISKR